MSHLRYVHGYHSVARLGPISVDGPLLVSDFDLKSSRTVAKFIPFTLDISARTQIYGLGYSYVEIREHSIGMNMRLWVMVTPVDGTLVDMSLASQVEEIRRTRRRFSSLGLLPVRMRAPLVNKFVAAMQKQDVNQDIVIWRRKRYQSRPRLCRSDGEIMPFRAYCAQFYPNLNNSEEETPTSAKVSTA